MKKLIGTKATANYLGVEEQTLANWRYLNKGPRWYRIGGRVKYDQEELDAFIESNAVEADGRPAA